MNNTMLSVVIPIYNAGKTLERCLVTIQNQTFTDYELILVDDGSLDESGRLCDIYASKHSNVKVLHQNNKGASAARNCGIENASGKYLMFVDSDDEVGADEFSEYVSAAERDSADVVIGGLTYIEAVDGSRRYVTVPKTGTFEREIWNAICSDSEPFGYMVSKLFRLRIIKENGIYFNTTMKSQEDLDFCLSYYRYCERFSLIKYTGYFYYHEPSKRTIPPADYVNNQLKLLTNARSQYDLLDKKSENKVKTRIIGFIWGLFYGCTNISDIRKVKEIIDATDVKKRIGLLKVNSEKNYVFYLYYRSRVRSIQWYFKFRTFLKRLKR